jgi:formylglycine-generating enzyme required for sulfatase activity
VTQAQWAAVAKLEKVNIDLQPDPANFKGKDRPVEQISWWEAVEFCDRLSRKTGKAYRLPSEAEWEYACRAGSTTPFHFGETISTDLANYRGQDWEFQGKIYPGKYGNGNLGEFREQTTTVGSFPPNAFGLHDMHGNVWEWCADHWHETYDLAPKDGSTWIEGGNSDLRLLRGGSWGHIPLSCRSASRYSYDPTGCVSNFGFRVVVVGS